MTVDQDRVEVAWRTFANRSSLGVPGERDAFRAGWKAAADALTPQERTVQVMSPMEKEHFSREALLADLRARRADAPAPPADTGDGGAAGAPAPGPHLPDTDKVEAAGLYLFPDWDDLPSGVRCGARALLGYTMAWGTRLAAAEQRIADLTRERDEAHEAAGDYASHLERAERERDEAAESRLARVREALDEAIRQIEYLHEKFRETGSGNGVLARLRAALTDSEPADRADREASRP